MELESFRRMKRWSQGQLAQAVGLKSKSAISMIETGERTASLRVALKIERISGGLVPAASICPEAAELGASTSEVQ